MFFDKHENLLNLVTVDAKSKILIAGDFNINFFVDSSATLECLNIFNSFGFTKQIDKTTRKCKTNETCIDNVFTNFQLSQSTVIDLDLSDHYGIKTNIKINSKRPINFTRFRSRVNADNIAKVKYDLNDLKLIEIFKNAPDNKKCSVFSETFNAIINKHMPIAEKKKKTIAESQKFIKDELCLKLRYLSKLYFDTCKDHPKDNAIKEMYKNIKEKYLQTLTNCIKLQNGNEINNAKKYAKGYV